MTKEALKLALEALYPIAHNTTDDPRGQADKAITAIKETLAEHAMCEVQRLGQEIEQEPVAFASHGVINWIADKQFQHEADLYTTPPQRAEQSKACVYCGQIVVKEKSA